MKTTSQILFALICATFAVSAWAQTAGSTVKAKPPQITAEEMLEKYNGAWKGSIEPVYQEYAF